MTDKEYIENLVDQVRFLRGQVVIYLVEINKANKGIRRLVKKNKRLNERIELLRQTADCLGASDGNKG